MDKVSRVDELNVPELMIKFKNITEELIYVVEREQYDDLDKLIKMRQLIIDKLSASQYSKEEFKNICTELKIINLQKNLIDLLAAEKNRVADKIKKLSDSRSANKNYNKRFYADSLFFNKKI